MILKLDISPEQLNALHKYLDNVGDVGDDIGDDYTGNGSGNFWNTHPGLGRYVWIISVKGVSRGRKESVSCYNVVLEVRETYYRRHHNPIFTPLSRLANVLHAIGLFPAKDGQPEKQK